MTKSYFLKLMRKYLRGEATIEEREFLFSYYNLFESEPDIIALMSDTQRENLENQMQTAIWQGINKYHNEREHRKTRYRRLIRTAAAAAAVIIICTAAVIFMSRNTPEKPQIVQSYQQKEHHFIHLPDGSTVIVSAGSKLNYPSSFDGLDTREVYLDGQAYFDVRHNSSKPFIVHTGKLKVTVLGTAFNINALPGNSNITVTVTRGKVKVADSHTELGIITPNQQISYSKNNARAVKINVDAEKYLDWKDQDIQLDNVTVEEAMELLEERFNVNITCDDELIRLQRFTTVFLKSESLEQILNSICEFNGAVYRYDKEKALVTISSKIPVAN